MDQLRRQGLKPMVKLAQMLLAHLKGILNQGFFLLQKAKLLIFLPKPELHSENNHGGHFSRPTLITMAILRESVIDGEIEVDACRL
jgi:hypothetical protein